jgi:hypothetical protein
VCGPSIVRMRFKRRPPTFTVILERSKVGCVGVNRAASATMSARVGGNRESAPPPKRTNVTLWFQGGLFGKRDERVHSTRWWKRAGLCNAGVGSVRFTGARSVDRHFRKSSTRAFRRQREHGRDWLDKPGRLVRAIALGHERPTCGWPRALWHCHVRPSLGRRWHRRQCGEHVPKFNLSNLLRRSLRWL